MPSKTKINVKEKVEDNVCDLSLSELKEVPVREIASFKRVNVLDLSSNRLLSLGKNFTLLTRLVKLDLSKNKIKFLPDDIGLLRNLRHLDLYDNQLQHLPLTFGDLNSLRYLDLNCNPLNTALAKVVGYCLTNQGCQEAAKRTVKFMSLMHTKAIKVKEQYVKERQEQTLASLNKENNGDKVINDKAAGDLKKSKKSIKKSKSKKKLNSDNQHQTSAIATTTATITGTTVSSSSSSATGIATDVNLTITKTTKSKRSANGLLKTNAVHNHGTALSSLIIFLLLSGVNIFLIYMIMFKNPEIAEKLVEAIPHQYRDWIVTKTEIFRLRVTDWISQFRTPPEEH